MFHKINPLVFVVFLFLVSCKSFDSKPDIKNITVDLKIMHFEKDLFNVDYAHLNDTIPFLKNKYGEFFDLFSYKIIRIGSPDNPSYPQYLTSFLTDYNINKVKKVVDSTFTNFDDTYGKELELMFRYYRYYFKDGKIPTVITYISGFNQSIVTTDTLIGISLDKYLGDRCPFYPMLGIPRYIIARMTPEYIPVDCARAWAITQYPLNDSAGNILLSNIIYEGKLIYFSKMLLPDESDSILFKLNSSQLEWCKKYEAKMWEYLVDKKQLFSTDNQLIKKYVDDAPFTKDFGQQSPGRAVAWIGYNIVSSYIRNTKASLISLMCENDYNRILRLSKYNP
jgi:hypothetical protein